MKMQSGLRVVLLAIVVMACHLSVCRGSPIFSQRESGQEYGQLLINNGDMRKPQLERSGDDVLSKRAATRDMRRSDFVLQSLLNLIIGEWDNRDQVKTEKEAPSTPAKESHPFYRVMIARAPIRLFRRPAVPVYFQNEIETPRGTIRTAFLMVLYDEEDNVRMHTYAFRNKEKVIDNWQNKRVFRSLRRTDLIDLGENCEQQWEPDQNGGFIVKSTVGTCIAPMDGQRVILDIGNVAKQSSLSLRFNILTTERAPIMVWATPFIFTRYEEDVPIVDRMLKQFLGKWNNRLQVANESRVSPPMPARDRHPDLTSIVVRADTKLFTSPEVAIYIQDGLSTPAGKQQIPHLMVLKPLDKGVRLHPYIFKNPDMIIDNWQSKEVFESLTMDDLVDIGPDCEQQFETTPTGGFSANNTLGICQGRMSEQQVIQDIGTDIESNMIILKYNILLMDGTPFMAWPTPFQLTRSLEGAESSSPVSQLLNQLLGRWNNRHQVQKEDEAHPPILPDLKHPLFRTTVVQAATSLFSEEQVPVYMQNDMYMEQGLQKTGFLMVLVDYDQGVRMHTYAFRNPDQVIDKWDDPETFENLAMSDLIDLQTNCEQQWYPQNGGGFFNPNTTGPCYVQMGNLQLSLDLSCRVNPNQLQLKYNMFMPDGGPFIFWAEPFEFTRIPDLSYDTVVDTLFQGGDVHYSLDLSSCSLQSASAQGEAWTPYVGASRLAKINGKVDYFQQQMQGSSQMIHFSSMEMSELHIAVDVFYHESENVVVQLHHDSRTDQQPTTFICDSMTGDRYMESVFSVHKSYKYRQLTVYRELTRAASKEKHMKLVIDRPDQGCVSDRPIPPSSYGIGLQTFFRNELDTTIFMTAQWLSHGVGGCGDALSHTQAHSMSVRVNVGGDSLFLHHTILNLQTSQECMSIEMVCPIIHDADMPGARVYP